ncbi:MAG: hypothetical protein FAZ92_03093 [Accumulibacter sp.]|jgi:hypothetical protein|uniref:methyl-accepting chemotaxis protein n=1 Tax=Accumulibacter sp. TaxID=2053492 RepID=UPI00120EE810|nr:methyl-accepting chemotaxis protein [Accumulibacter sp.]TLD44674.1 MAG: hypothetical protein FAZ92_03093 [Accumulibacter sp.]
MKGILNLLAKAKLVELSDDERLAVPASPAEPEVAPVAPAAQAAAVATAALPAESELPSLAEACGEVAGLSFADIFAAAAVPPSPYPAEKLLRLLDGLRAMDAVTRRAAVLAMDAADDNWQIDDCLRDAELKIAALEEHKSRLAAQMESRERQSAEIVDQIRLTLDEATAAIRQQISELEQLREREVTRAAQETTSVEAGLRAARESVARETRRIDGEIERLREIPNSFRPPAAGH